MGKVCGKRVFVFNCDEGMDAKSICTIVKGVLLIGEWVCFDEFNRLNGSVLSSIFDLITTIQSSIKQETKHITVDGKTMEWDYRSVGIFVTLNPPEYGGRSIMPENVASLFRMVHMTEPDCRIITRVSLLIHGYVEAEHFANCILFLCKMGCNILYKEKHYEWGLRAVKSVLSAMATATKKTVDTLIAALQAVFLPRLHQHDKKMFFLWLTTFFGSVKEEKKSAPLSLHLPHHPLSQQSAVTFTLLPPSLQLLNALQHKTGCLLLGKPGSGTLLDLH